jgi:hypothetical protein
MGLGEGGCLTGLLLCRSQRSYYYIAPDGAGNMPPRRFWVMRNSKMDLNNVLGLQKGFNMVAVPTEIVDV